MAFTHVLIPTDFSEPAHHALRCALEEATLHHARVTLLHVLPAHMGTDVYFVTGAPGAQSGPSRVPGTRTSLPGPRRRRLCALPTSAAPTSLSWGPAGGRDCPMCSWAVSPKRWYVWHHAQY